MAKIGRPKGATNIASRAVKELIDECVDMKEVIGKLIELVEGVEIAELVNGETIVYTTKPDVYAAKILLEYRYGKPKETKDVTVINLPLIIDDDTPAQPNSIDSKAAGGESDTKE